MDQMRKKDGYPVQLTIEVESGEDEVKLTREVFQAKGKVYQKGELFYLTYTEKSGEGTVHNILKLAQNRLTVIRHGAVKMNHLFQLGHSTQSHFSTPLGPLAMETYTTALTFSCSPSFQTMLKEGRELKEGRASDSAPYATLRWAYRLTLAGQPAGYIRFQITLLKPGG